MIPKLCHQSDWALYFKECHYWHFVYIHGKAEKFMGELQNDNNWEWSAPDLFISDKSMPVEPGEYPVEIYGNKAIAVLALRHGHMAGRVAFESDEIGLAHARKIEDWR